ncbi:MAG TPA: hypothetical protein PKY29_02730 [Ferruginibacter sp.]|nr:hypothetical protein [Ferruginibacter sp.]HRO16826.1 hypothetical protein [Ferruginibacter sp.]HRQ20198.1 hypothetical protein [Ferruginibacter sp.]
MGRWFRIWTLLLILFGYNGYAQTHWLQDIPKVGKLPLKISIEYKSADKGIQIDSLTWNQAGLQALELYNETFRYFVRESVTAENTNVYIISRIHSEEQKYWVCLFDKSNRLSDFLLAAYDNSEGFLTRESRILPQGYIEITEYSEFEGSEEQWKYSINGLKFKKVN